MTNSYNEGGRAGGAEEEEREGIYVCKESFLPRMTERQNWGKGRETERAEIREKQVHVL